MTRHSFHAILYKYEHCDNKLIPPQDLQRLLKQGHHRTIVVRRLRRQDFESKVVGGLGVASKGLGKAIGAIPVIREGPIDEALLNAGTSLGRRNRDTVANKLSALSSFEENYTGFFVESLASVHLICNADNAMLTDGENLYILKEA